MFSFQFFFHLNTHISARELGIRGGGFHSKQQSNLYFHLPNEENAFLSLEIDVIDAILIRYK